MLYAYMLERRERWTKLLSLGPSRAGAARAFAAVRFVGDRRAVVASIARHGQDCLRDEHAETVQYRPVSRQTLERRGRAHP